MGRFSVIILAAGRGTRMNLGYNKVFFQIEKNTTILEKSVKAFYSIKEISQIIVVVSEDDLYKAKEILKGYHNIQYVIGGAQRHESVFNGLNKVVHGYVLVHDAARCFIKKDAIDKLIKATLDNRAASLALPIRDTIHLVDDDNMVVQTIDRDYAYLAQTPQGFETIILMEAYTKYYQAIDQISITDDVMLVNTYTDIQVKLIESSASNYKVTFKEDSEILEGV